MYTKQKPITRLTLPIVRIPGIKYKKKKKRVDDDDDTELSDPNSAPGVLVSDPDDLLRLAGVYYISGEITDSSLTPIQQDIIVKHISGPHIFNGDIKLIINSPGGSLDATNALIDLIENVRLNVSTVGLGTCCSGAAMLLAAGTKGKRIVGKNTTIMIHRFTWGAYDKQPELLAMRKIQDDIHTSMMDFWLRHSKYKTKKQVEKHLLPATDKWLTAEEALAHGIVDHIGYSRG